VVRNGERFLAAALGSAAAQTAPPAEVVVVDGRSTDATARIARAVPGVRHLLQTGTGLADARNQGIAAARHELIAFLDHDDLWEPAKLAAQVARLEDPAIDYSLTWMRFFVEPGTAPPTRIGAAGLETPRAAGTPSALLARRALFDRVGGFDGSLAIGCDADWFARARDRGAVCAMVDEVLVRKRLHGANLSTDLHRNRREMFEVARRSIARRRGEERPA
jgi:glycosyltransferase involved in cell wall biosynthesis